MTRAALITAPAAAGIAVIRVVASSPNLTPAWLTTPDHRPHNLLLHRVSRHTIIDQQGTIDDVLIGPVSEYIIDIYSHGGMRIIQRILLHLQHHNITITPDHKLQPPESIAQETAHCLAYAPTELACRTIAYQHPHGLYAWKQNALATLASNPHAASSVIDDITQLLADYPLTQKLLTPSQVLIIGPPNVGKSTLANALTGQQQSLVADIPGTTRDWTMHLTQAQGVPITLIDSAGYRTTTNTIEQAGIDKITQLLPTTALILHVTDSRDTQPMPLELPLPPTIPVLNVYNKTDLLSDPPNHQSNHAIYLSAQSRCRLHDLRYAIARQLGFNDFNPHLPRIFTPRQHQILQNAISHTTSLNDTLAAL